MFCYNCGKGITDNNIKYCPNCGEKIITLTKKENTDHSFNNEGMGWDSGVKGDNAFREENKVTDVFTDEDKRNKLIIKALLWIFLFPVMCTIWIVNRPFLRLWAKIAAIIIVWIVAGIFWIGRFGTDSEDGTVIEKEAVKEIEQTEQVEQSEQAEEHTAKKEEEGSAEKIEETEENYEISVEDTEINAFSSEKINAKGLDEFVKQSIEICKKHRCQSIYIERTVDYDGTVSVYYEILCKKEDVLAEKITNELFDLWNHSEYGDDVMVDFLDENTTDSDSGRVFYRFDIFDGKLHKYL